MPFIQIDITEGLSAGQLADLRDEVVTVVHESIGPALAHINVAIRELPPGRIVEAGCTGPVRAVSA